jgi:SAM-dependent methyltransferase
MPTPAEKYMVEKLVSFLETQESDSRAHRILNAGAGQSVSVERRLMQVGCRYVCDRMDITDCNVVFPTVGECWKCSIDDMRPLSSGRYIAVFANYVLEHVENLGRASREIYRILTPGGQFFATIPNTSAPEFVLARHLPLWFHRLIRRGHAWETKYTYDNISELLDYFLENGFEVEEERRWPIVEGYLGRYPIVSRFGNLYDKLVSTCKCKSCMGDVCLVLRRPT